MRNDVIISLGNLQFREESDKNLETKSSTCKCLAFTLADVFSPHFVGSRKCAFTLAEVLITLGIIGVVAAMTLPSIIAKTTEQQQKTGFKAAYSILNNAVIKAKADIDNPSIMCHSWENSSDRPCTTICTGRNDYGTCTGYNCVDGSPMPANINGRYEDCSIFKPYLWNNLKIVKTCTKGYADGCFPDYAGSDTIAKASDPSANPDPNISKSQSSLRKRPGYVLSNGMILIDMLVYSGWPIIAVDINGSKNPNKWGHDVFTFEIVGDNYGIRKVMPSTHMVLIEENGKSPSAMLQWVNGK